MLDFCMQNSKHFALGIFLSSVCVLCILYARVYVESMDGWMCVYKVQYHYDKNWMEIGAGPVKGRNSIELEMNLCTLSS